jgi:P53 DNA-binding domain
MDKACPISFRMDNLPQEFHRYCIRGQMVYSKADHFQGKSETLNLLFISILTLLFKYFIDPVERCPAHKGTGPPLPYTPHVLRCEDSDSAYVDHIDMRHSVIVPLKAPAPGTQSVSLCYKFMCLSSCQGGLNRRPTKLIFTLESLT